RRNTPCAAGCCGPKLIVKLRSPVSSMAGCDRCESNVRILPGFPAGRAGNTARRAVSQPTVLRVLDFDYSAPLSDWKTLPGPDRAGASDRTASCSWVAYGTPGAHSSSPCYDIKRE